MAKLPYFPLYVNDWLGSTTITTFTPEQEGGFIRLLCHAWSNPDCTIPGDEQELMALSRLSSQALAKLLAKAWLPCKLGYYNSKLRVVKEAYEAHSKAMSEAGKKGVIAKKELKLQGKEPQAKLKPSVSKASAKDKLSLASALALTSSSSIASSKKVKTTCPDSLRLSGLLADLILLHTPDHKDLSNGNRERTVKSWAKDIDLMIRLDKRSPENIEQVIIFAQQDSFWFKNILSGSKLRKQFDRLGMNMKQPSRDRNDKHAGIDQWLKETYYDRQ